MSSRSRLVASAAFCVAIATAFSFAAPPTSQPSATPKVGQPAPDFSLQSLDGKDVKLSEADAEHAVVLVVLRGWPGYQCPICTKQVGDLIAPGEAITATGASVILVYPGPADDLKAHADEFAAGKSLPPGFTFVIDPDYVFTNAYHLRWDAKGETAYPSTFVIDKKGIVRFEKVSTNHAGRAMGEVIVAALKKL